MHLLNFAIDFAKAGAQSRDSAHHRTEYSTITSFENLLPTARSWIAVASQ